MNTDRIEKNVFLAAPRARVWGAIHDAKKFGAWFRAAFDGEFVEGETTRGRILVEGYEHLQLAVEVVKIEPERYFAFRWHPYPADPKVDYASEPTTLVEFTLEEVNDGVRLTIVESGFDRLPLARRAEAFRMNEGGWAAQARNIEAYVTKI